MATPPYVPQGGGAAPRPGAAAPGQPSPAGFPRMDPTAQREQERLRVLQDEMLTAQQQLRAAQAANDQNATQQMQ